MLLEARLLRRSNPVCVQMKTELPITLISVTRGIFSATGLKVTLMSAVIGWAGPAEGFASTTKNNRNVSNASCLLNAKSLVHMVISRAQS